MSKRTAKAAPEAVRRPAHDLDALGVIGLRMSDLQEANIACCGDCQSFTLLARGSSEVVPVCAHGYTTTLYSLRAVTCPAFTVRAPLPDTPQGNERAGEDRRIARRPVLVERRGRSDRRRTPA
jgi:hypothetical protein